MARTGSWEGIAQMVRSRPEKAGSGTFKARQSWTGPARTQGEGDWGAIGRWLRNKAGVGYTHLRC